MKLTCLLARSLLVALLPLATAAAQREIPLARYAACSIAEGPAVVETAPLNDDVHSRPVDTFRGRQTVTLDAGLRVMFAYPGEAFYANLKAERLPADTWDVQKKVLLDNFAHVLASEGNSRNYGMKSTLNGLEISGLDREKLEGGVLGIYLLFDNIRHDVLTIYFLNQEESRRHFKTLSEYARLRDHFLAEYTQCLARH